MDSISVVIPTHNRSRLAVRAVESALAQEPRPREVIVVDDGSTDDTPAVLGALPGVRYLRRESAGPSAARNAGIRAAESEWVAFLDDDDWFLPGKLAQDLAILREHPDTGLLYGCAHRISAEGADLGPCPLNHRPPADPLPELLRENFVNCQTVVARRSLLLEVGLFDEGLRYGEDIDLWVRLALHGARFRFAPEPLTQIERRLVSISADPTGILEAMVEIGVRHRAALTAALGDREWWLAPPHYRLGRVWYERGRLERAREHLRAALAADPGHRGARLYLFLCRLGPLGRWPLAGARGLKRFVVRGLVGRGWREARW